MNYCSGEREKKKRNTEKLVTVKATLNLDGS